MANLGPDFRVIGKLGEGTFAEVFKVKSVTGQVFAVKRLKKRYRAIDEVNRLPEILSLKQFQGHPNVIDLVDVIYDNKNGSVAMVFELMDCNVYELISQHRKPFDEDTTLILIYQLLSAIALMHSKNMFHRDVKPENCMVNKNTMVLKLADFGSTRGVASTAPYTEYVSTRWYRAPECILTSGSYGPEVDEWAVGCMIYELLTTRPLFPGNHEVDQITRIHALLGTPTRDVLAQFNQNPNTQISLRFATREPQDFHKLLPKKTSEETIDLMLKLLTYNPQSRITAQEALKHPAFERIRECEKRWQMTDRSVPFPSYFLHGDRNNENVVPQAQMPTALLQCKPKRPVPIIEQKPKPAVYVPKPGGLLPKPLIAEPLKIAPKPAPGMLFPVNKYKAAPAVDQALIESRIKAAQRIKAFQEKALANAAAKKKQQMIYQAQHVQLSKPIVNNGFEKPRPEILKARPPKIVL